MLHGVVESAQVLFVLPQSTAHAVRSKDPPQSAIWTQSLQKTKLVSPQGRTSRNFISLARLSLCCELWQPLHRPHSHRSPPYPGGMIRNSLEFQLECREWECCGHYSWLERAVREEFFLVLCRWLEPSRGGA